MSTANMLLTRVKGNLDKNLLDSNMFRPNLQHHSLYDVVGSTIKMLNLDAEMHGVKLIFSGFIDGGDRQVLMDQLRT